MYLLHKRYLWIVVYSIVSNLMNTAAYTHIYTQSHVYKVRFWSNVLFHKVFFQSWINRISPCPHSCFICVVSMKWMKLYKLHSHFFKILFLLSCFGVPCSMYTTLKNIIFILLLCLSAEHFSIITFLLDCKPCNWHTQWLLVAHKHSKSMQWPTAATHPTSTTYSATVLPKQWSSWYIIHFDFSERVFPMHIDFFHPTRKSLSLSRALSPSPYLCLSWNFVRK